MTEEISKPLVEPEVDLRGLPFMPLDIVRLLDSDIFALSTGDEFKAAVALWGRSWLQVPAASLPDDDRVLAHLSSAGSRWKRVKSMALRGWIKCTDGRWYHPVVAEKAQEAWKHRLAQRARANKRWQGSVDTGASKSDAAADATASKNNTTAHATAMQGTGTGTVKGQVLQPQSQKPPLRVAEPIFGEWIEFLQGKGVKEASARTFIGLMRKGYGDELVVEVMAEAERQDITHPKSWISRALQVRSTKRGQTIENREPSQTAQGVALLESMKERR